MNKVQTDNSNLLSKREIRKHSLKGIDQPRILECFAGNSNLWRTKTTKIDKKRGLKGIYLCGDNIKFLMNMDLSRFDIIDLDAYGIPFNQLEIIFKRKFKGIVHVTFIQSMMGIIKHKLLEKLGYTKNMILKCPTLFARNGVEKLFNYLFLNKIKKVYIISDNRKNYLYFKTNGK